jgi:hypothetical protein
MSYVTSGIKWAHQNFAVTFLIKLAALTLIWSPHATWLPFKLRFSLTDR